MIMVLLVIAFPWTVTALLDKPVNVDLNKIRIEVPQLDVPPITFGALIVSAIGDLVHDAGGVIDVHLMIERPERHVTEFARAGADNITVHAEATPHLNYALQAIREATGKGSAR